MNPANLSNNTASTKPKSKSPKSSKSSKKSSKTESKSVANDNPSIVDVIGFDSDTSTIQEGNTDAFLSDIDDNIAEPVDNWGPIESDADNINNSDIQIVSDIKSVDNQFQNKNLYSPEAGAERLSQLPPGVELGFTYLNEIDIFRAFIEYMKSKCTIVNAEYDIYDVNRMWHNMVLNYCVLFYKQHFNHDMYDTNADYNKRRCPKEISEYFEKTRIVDILQTFVDSNQKKGNDTKDPQYQQKYYNYVDLLRKCTGTWKPRFINHSNTSTDTNAIKPSINQPSDGQRILHKSSVDTTQSHKMRENVPNAAPVAINRTEHTNVNQGNQDNQNSSKLVKNVRIPLQNNQAAQSTTCFEHDTNANTDQNQTKSQYQPNTWQSNDKYKVKSNFQKEPAHDGAKGEYQRNAATVSDVHSRAAHLDRVSSASADGTRLDRISDVPNRAAHLDRVTPKPDYNEDSIPKTEYPRETLSINGYTSNFRPTRAPIHYPNYDNASTELPQPHPHIVPTRKPSHNAGPSRGFGQDASNYVDPNQSYQQYQDQGYVARGGGYNGYTTNRAPIRGQYRGPNRGPMRGQGNYTGNYYQGSYPNNYNQK